MVLAKSKMRGEKGSLHIIEVASVNDAGELKQSLETFIFSMFSRLLAYHSSLM